ncbi:MAG: hypothetical protein AAGG55_01505 [Pseudomonadota bacterium]
MLRSVIAFFPAVISAYLIGSVLATQVILAEVASLGLPITLRDRLHATGHDVLGLATSYLPLMLIAFVIAIPVASYLSRLLPKQQAALFSLAGIVAVTALHLIMEAVLGLNGIAAVREWHGLVLQAAAGGIGGYLFFVFTGRALR